MFAVMFTVISATLYKCMYLFVYMRTWYISHIHVHEYYSTISLNRTFLLISYAYEWEMCTLCNRD